MVSTAEQEVIVDAKTTSKRRGHAMLLGQGHMEKSQIIWRQRE
jgi:hypothetical protein